MHADEVATDAVLMRRLLAAQCPQWADLPIAAVASAGTDNALYRLGDDMVVRLPRIGWAVGQAEKEWRWLPILAPRLPLAVPLPLALGEPAEGYPWPWTICRWLAGENATADRIADPRWAALDLARFIAALQQIDATDGPPPGAHNSHRGERLANRDAATRRAITQVRDEFSADDMTAIWDAAIAAPAWGRPPVWIHGDLQAGNLLATAGRLSAVIDWGCLGVGDPACDVMAAWLWLDAETRPVFRAALGVDDVTWTRARGWALTFGLIALPYYRDTNPTLAAIAWRAIHEALGTG